MHLEPEARRSQIVQYLADAAGTHNLVVDASITHDRIGSSTTTPQLNGTLSFSNTPDAALNEAANRKLNKYRNPYANNHIISFKEIKIANNHNISFKGATCSMFCSPRHERLAWTAPILSFSADPSEGS